MKKRKLRALSYAKINLSLNVSGKNGEGMHLLDSVTASVSIADAVTVCERFDSQINVTYDGRPSVYENDSVKKAVVFLQKRFGNFGLDVAVEKHLPEGAGIGGSSADAAAAIVLADRLFDFVGRGLDVKEAAGEVGSDVPLMCNGGFCRLTGIGENIERINGAEKMFNIVLYCGERGVSTAECFKLFDEKCPSFAFSPSDNESIASALKSGQARETALLCGNALTEFAAEMDDSIYTRMEALKEAGALNSFMTGSGSACAGIFENKAAAECAAEILNKKNRGKAFALVTVPNGIKII